MPSTFLDDRGLVRVSGSEARGFLQGLFTCDMEKVAPGAPGFGALLTAQGKIIVDFFVHQQGENTFLLDAPQSLLAQLLKLLRLYRLRAVVEIEDVSAAMGVAAIWDEAPPAGAEPDPRHPGLGARLTGERAALAALPVERSAYDARRIACGVPEGGRDFPYGDTFPHEANMDLVGGVDFKKGCYVGQEVVSRVQHRGTARRRILQVSFDGEALAPGTPIRAGETEVGVLGSSVAGHGLASIRTDRAHDASVAGTPLTLGTLPMTLGALASGALPSGAQQG